MLLTIVLSLAAAAALALALIRLGPVLPHGSHGEAARGGHCANPHAGHPDHAVDSAVIVCLVVLSAIAGAIRYLTEKLGYEAEAIEYRGALQRFWRAEEILCEAADDPDRQQEAHDVVLELGRMALIENEAWLKSRRERPLAPVVG